MVVSTPSTLLVEPGAPLWAQRLGLRLVKTFQNLFPTQPTRLWKVAPAGLPNPADWTGSLAFGTDGAVYKSDGAAWAALGGGGGGVPEAPNDGQRYARGSLAWVPTVSFPEAPNDGAFYARRNLAWAGVVSFPEAPNDGQFYARQSLGWAVNPATGGTTILNGAGPPAVALGVAGNYYLDQTARWLYGPKAAGGGPTESVFNTVPVAFVTDPANTYTVGRQITFLVPGRVMGLRWYRPAGITTTARTLRLYTDAGVSLGTVATVGEAGVGWVSVNFGVPVVVTGGQVVRVGYDIAANNPIGQVNPGPASASSSMTAGVSGFFGTPSGTFPNNTNGNVYFADVLFEPTWPLALKSAP